SAKACPRTLHGFTLVELLVVIAIIAVLMALLLPAVQSARESGRRAACANNLKQLALGSIQHLTAFGHYPTGGWDSASVGMISPNLGSDWRQPGGWGYTILPFIEQTNVFNAVNLTQPLPIYACPSRRGSSIGPSGQVMTDYAGNRGSWASSLTPVQDRTTTFGMPSSAGTLPTVYPSTLAGLQSLQTLMAAAAGLLSTPQMYPLTSPLATGTVATGGVIFVGSALPDALIRDGRSNTYLFGEKYVPVAAYAIGTIGYQNVAFAGDSPDTLRGGYRVPVSDATTPIAVNNTGAFGGPHLGVFNAAMCDGSVQSISFDISAQIHFLLACRADRQSVSPD
ncbi:MAG: DUF1559 domain-containing protein, partial [Pirellulales bacterium]